MNVLYFYPLCVLGLMHIFYTSCPSVVAAIIAPIMMVFFVEDALLCASVSQRWDRKRCWGESWEAFSSMHSGSWMIVSACIRLVTALCRASLVWMSAPLLQLNLPYHSSSKAACLPHCPCTDDVSSSSSNLIITSQGMFAKECGAGKITLHDALSCVCK